MIFTMLDKGATALTRARQNRERFDIHSIAFGGSIGYTVDTANMLDLQGTKLHTQLVDVLSIAGDTATLRLTLSKDVVFSCGEAALYLQDGTCIALHSMSTILAKTRGSAVTLTFTLTYTGLGVQVEYSTDTLILARTRPDYSDIRTQLLTHAYQTGKFKQLITNEAGNTVIELLAGVGELSGYLIESSYQEAFPDTAKVTTSQYAIQTMLRNRITRKAPAGVTVQLTRPLSSSALTIPPYTQFICDKVSLFNRSSIVFAGGVATKTVSLYEGVVTNLTLAGKDQPYQFFILPETGFTVADNDVRVTVNGIQIPVVVDGLWNYQGTDAVQDFTDKFGRAVLTFGTAALGTMPRLTDTISLTYVVTTGLSGNTKDFSGKSVTVATYPTLTGLTTSDLTGGGDQPSTSLFQRVGGDLYGGQRGAVTAKQYAAVARNYPGVVDAVVLGQRSLAPMDKNWFNTAKVVLLTSSAWTNTEVEAFRSWYEARTMYSMRYVILAGVSAGDEPRQRPVDIDVVIACRNDVDLNYIQSLAESEIKSYYAAKAGILSRDVFRSDIINLIMGLAPAQADHVILKSPAADIGMDLANPTNVTAVVTAGTGTLPIGWYNFAVTSYDAEGEAPASVIRVEVTAPNSSITFNWDAVGAASGYRIYGRTDPIGRLTTLLPTVTTFTDNGTLTTSAVSPPSINTSGIHYAVINSIKVTAQYAQRTVLEA